MIGAIEPMQVDMPEENENDAGGEEQEEQNYIVENPSLDLESHSNAYTGLAKLHRLQFIAEHCPVYTIEALKLAISHCQNTYNTALYQKLHRKLTDVVAGTANGQGGPLGGGAANIPDVADGVGLGDRTVPALELNWIDARNKKFQTKLEKLDNDLKNYKSNSIKESIRRGQDDLGDHFLDGGDLANALKCYR